MLEKVDEIYLEIKRQVKRRIRSPNMRKTIIYFGLLVLIFLYLAGIFSQFFLDRGSGLATGHSPYQTANEFTVNPFRCIYIALTNGFIGIFIVIVLIGAGYYHYVISSKFKDGKPIDERGILKGDSDAFGSAQWMPSDIIRKLFKVGDVDDIEETIIGTLDGEVIAFKEGRHLKNKNMLITASSGQGKTKSFAVNYVYQCMRRNESIIMTDPKQDVFGMTYPALKATQNDPDGGYDIKVFNLKNPALSDGWDCLGDIQGCIKMATSFATSVIANTSGDEKGPRFFNDSDINLLIGLLMREDAERENQTDEYRQNTISQAKTVGDFPDGTLPKMYEKFIRTDNGLKSTKFGVGSAISSIRQDQPWYIPLNLFAQGSETIQQSAIMGLGLRLGLLQNTHVSRMLSRNDISLVAPAQRKCAYFIIMDDTDHALDYVASLFFSCLFQKLMDYADNQPNQKCPVPVSMLIDEAANIGKIPELEQKLATIRSRDINAVLIYQQISQIEENYPGKKWNTLMGNCATHVVLGSGDDITNKYYSDRCGAMTIKTKSQRVDKKTIDFLETHPRYNEGYAENKRMLLNPDEVESLGKKDKILVKMVNQDPFIADKFFYKNHPYGRVIDEENLVSVEDYFASKKTTLSKQESKEFEFEKKINETNKNGELCIVLPTSITNQTSEADEDDPEDLIKDNVRRQMESDDEQSDNDLEIAENPKDDKRTHLQSDTSEDDEVLEDKPPLDIPQAVQMDTNKSKNEEPMSETNKPVKQADNKKNKETKPKKTNSLMGQSDQYSDQEYHYSTETDIDEANPISEKAITSFEL